MFSVLLVPVQTRSANPNHVGGAEDESGERAAQQDHHTAGTRPENIAASKRGEVSGGSVAAGALRLRGLWVSHLPDHPEHQAGHVMTFNPWSRVTWGGGGARRHHDPPTARTLTNTHSQTHTNRHTLVPVEFKSELFFLPT